MKQTWAPWRLQYVVGPKEQGCFICNAAADKDHDRERLVLYRDEHALVLLNRFPYNNGHILVTPTAHVADPTDLDEAVFCHVTALLRESVRLVRQVYRPDGMNLGMNLGHVAGAGLPGHMHWHAVPRWEGDTNFMPVLADTRCIVEHIEHSWEVLRPLFDGLALPARLGG